MAHPFKAPPMSHQRQALRRAWRKFEFALFHDMGTGKTFTAINLAASRHLKDQIDALIVLCPTPIKNVWVEELEKWCPVEYEAAVVKAGASGKREAAKLLVKRTPKLKVLIAGVEALSQGTAADFVREFASEHRTFCVADESSKLKNAQSTRTKRAIEIARASQFRLIMTGTPITQGMEDLYAQFQFLNPKILRCRHFVVFRNRYCIMGGFENRSIVGYRDSHDLLNKVAPYVDVVKKEDVLDLPDKVYQTRYIDTTINQESHIKSLLEDFWSRHDEDLSKEIETETILERLTRIQQILGGNFPYLDGVETNARGKPKNVYKTTPIEGKNPKMLELLSLLEQLDHHTKVIVWCRFQPEIQAVKAKLIEIWGPDLVAEFSGANVKTRDEEAAEFQHGKRRFMVSNQAVGGMGQTWTAATVVIYYSNSFSYQDRMQSEDRAHRKGQTNKVTYIDLVMENKYDKMIITAIRKKGDVARFVEEDLVARREFMR